LNHFDIKKPLVSYYEHNKVVKGNYLVGQLLDGKSIALVSDAGTPGVSDPGEDIVKLCIENDIQVTMVPGPVAAVTGLVVSGLSTGRFVFEGFLPMNKRQRKDRINSLRNETRTIILYEAPHKLIYTLKDLYEALGNRRITMARELTKKFEEVIRCSLKEAVAKYDDESPRGEYVLIIEGISEEKILEEKKSEWDAMTVEEHYEMYIAKGLEKKEAMRKVAQDRGISRRDVYKKLLE
jgi:16S rRNA (cytidine1402-2'-O)-methyltransferase